MGKIQETPEEKGYRETVEKMANSISKLAKSVSELMNGPLNRKALLVLLASSSGQSKAVVDDVLSALEKLEKDWLK